MFNFLFFMTFPTGDNLDIFTGIYDFLVGVYDAIVNLITWIGDLAVKLNSIEFSPDSTVYGLIGLYRYLVGDTVFLIHVTTMYIGLFLMAIRIIPIFVSWWKKFSPFHS